jgi:hypothetical protein
MNDLLKYTDDQLREELKRRAIERRKNTPRELIYKEFEATIVEIYNVKCKFNGHTSYKPFDQWSFKVRDIVSDFPRVHRTEVYKLARGIFKKGDAPKVGDRVKLRYRKRVKGYEGFDMDKAKIVEIIIGKEV